jgi:hypothetical protein
VYVVHTHVACHTPVFVFPCGCTGCCHSVFIPTHVILSFFSCNRFLSLSISDFNFVSDILNQIISFVSGSRIAFPASADEVACSIFSSSFDKAPNVAP